MTSKERVLAALNFGKPDRVPFNFWMDRRRMAQNEERYGEGWRVTEFDADVVESFCVLAFPSSTIVEESGTSWVTEPLLKSMEDIDSLEMPDPANDEVYSQLRRDIEAYPDRAIVVNTPGVLTIAHGMREYSNLLMDVYDSPDQVKRFFGVISDIMTESVVRACELDITAVYVMDDIAYRQGLMMSLPMLEEFVFPFNRKMIDTARRAGVPVLMHSCGAVTDAIDSFVDQGIVAINPLQPHLHDLRLFKDRYHGKLAVYGALDNTYLIPDGTPDDVRAHVRETFELLGEGGGLIFSTHDIPFHTPEENLIAMIDEIKLCRY